jgi:hypothetical protein
MGGDWCKDYVRLPASATISIVAAHSGETEALTSLLTFLQMATNCLETKEQNVKPVEDVSLAQINTAISNALEVVPALQAKLHPLGWQGTRFGDRLSSSTLIQTIQAVRTFMDDLREASQVVRLRLCQTQLFPWCVATFHNWTQTGDRNPFKEVGGGVGGGGCSALKSPDCPSTGGDTGMAARATERGIGAGPQSGYCQAAGHQAERGRVPQAVQRSLQPAALPFVRAAAVRLLRREWQHYRH